MTLSADTNELVNRLVNTTPPTSEPPPIDTIQGADSGSASEGQAAGDRYGIQATDTVTPVDAGLVREVSSLVGTADQLTVASFNVENLDIKIEDPALTDQTDLDASDDVDDDVGSGKLAAIAQQIVAHLNSPDIIALQEIQDNDGTEISAENSASQTFEALIEAIAALGGPRYRYIDTPGIVPASIDSQGQIINPVGGAVGGNIRNGFLYNPQRVQLVDGSVQPLTDPIDQASNPDNPFYHSPIPLAATFRFNHQDVTLINHHFPSADLALGQEDPAIHGGLTERQPQATAILNVVDGMLASDANANIVVLGDVNDLEFIAPLPTPEPRLTNLAQTLPDDERSRYLSEGNSPSPDHVLVSHALLENAEFDAVHINREFTDRPSDHDPLLARFNFSFNPIGGTNQRDILTGTDQADRLEGLGGADVLDGGPGPDILIGGPSRDQLTGGPGRDQFVFQDWGDRTDQILDFQSDRDLIVLTELFDSLGYSGSDPFADGYVFVSQVGTLGSVVLVDPDGPGGPLRPEALAFLMGVEASSLTASSFVV